MQVAGRPIGERFEINVSFRKAPMLFFFHRQAGRFTRLEIDSVETKKVDVTQPCTETKNEQLMEKSQLLIDVIVASVKDVIITAPTSA